MLTQYLPRSLNEHIGIGRPWDLDRGRGGVRLLQPYQGGGHQDWYGGTADAVLQNLDYLRETPRRYRGDPVRRPHLQDGLPAHAAAHTEEAPADLTVAVMNVSPEETSRFGIVLTDENGRVTQFPGEAQGRAQHPGLHGHLRLQRGDVDSSGCRR